MGGSSFPVPGGPAVQDPAPPDQADPPLADAAVFPDVVGRDLNDGMHMSFGGRGNAYGSVADGRAVALKTLQQEDRSGRHSRRRRMPMDVDALRSRLRREGILKGPDARPRNLGGAGFEKTQIDGDQLRARGGGRCRGGREGGTCREGENGGRQQAAEPGRKSAPSRQHDRTLDHASKRITGVSALSMRGHRVVTEGLRQERCFSEPSGSAGMPRPVLSGKRRVGVGRIVPDVPLS